MTKTIRLTSAQNRDWSANIAQLVDVKGLPVQALTPNEEVACEEVHGMARKTEQSQKVTKRIKYPDPMGRATYKHIEIEARVTRQGAAPGEVLIYVYLEGMLKVGVREIIAARMLKEHGPCILKRQNGTFLRHVRDPKRIAKKAPDTNIVKTVPSPDSCACKAFGGTVDGKHNVICEFNLLAPPEERGVPLGGRTLSAKEQKKLLMKTPKKRKLYSPADCKCAAWEKKEGEENLHHRMCDNKEPWEERGREANYLVDLDTGKTVRKTTPQETAEAELHAQKNGGAPMLSIDGLAYAVVPKIMLKDPAEVEEVVGEPTPLDSLPIDGSDLESMPDTLFAPAEPPESLELPDLNAPIESADIDEGGLDLPGLEG